MAQRLCRVDEIPEGGAKGFDVGGRKIAVFRAGGKFYAVDSICTHHGGPLEEGALEGAVVTCPWHGATFDVSTGKALTPPAKGDVASHRVEVRGSELFVELAAEKKAELNLELTDKLEGDAPFSYKPFLDWLSQALKFKTKLYGPLEMRMLAQSAHEADFDMGEIHATEQDLKELIRIMEEAKATWGADITYCLYHTSHLPGHMIINVRGPKAPTSLAMDIKF